MNEFGMDLDRWFICSEKHWRHEYWWVFPSDRCLDAFGGPQRFEGSAAAFAAFREFFRVVPAPPQSLKVV